MTTNPPRRLPAASFALLVVAAALYIPWLLAVVNAPSWVEPGTGSGETRISEAWADFFVLLFGTPLWLVLGGLLLLAGRKGFASPAIAAISGILFVLALIATWIAAHTYFTWPGGWSILVPALLPALIALYGVWVRVPALAEGPARRVPAVALGAVMLVVCAAIVFAAIDPAGYPARLSQHRRNDDAMFARRNAEADEKARQWEDGIHKLGADSPLAAWLDYINGSVDGEPLHQAALEGARTVKSREADAVALLEQGQIRKLTSLWQFDIAATPALCAAYDQALTRLATTDEPYESEVGKWLEGQLPNVKFLRAAGCDLTSSVDAAAARIGKVAQVNPADTHWPQLTTTLSALRRSP